MSAPWRAFPPGDFANLSEHVPAPRTYVAHTVFEDGHMEPDRGAAPTWLEVDGRIYTGQDDDQEDRRRFVDRMRCQRIIARVGGAVASKALLRITTHLDDAHHEAMVEVIRDIGRVIMVQRHPELWKLLYLRLRDLQKGQVCDRMVDAFTVSGYQENDEFRFLFGENWRRAVESYTDTTEDDAVRAAVDGPPDGEEAEVVTGPPLNAITGRPTDEPGAEAFPA